MSVCYEIDFLPFSNDERGSGAICMRYGSPENYRVLIYDVGTEDAGIGLVKHIREHYQTDVIDDLVCSRSDPDQVAGLSAILENMTVLSLWMHRPWIHSPVIAKYVEDQGAADKRTPADLRAITATHSLEVLAARKHIRLREPFQGDEIGEFIVLSPNRDWYIEQLITKFGRAQDSEEFRIASEGLMQKSVEPTGHATESRNAETLREDVCTSFANNSSVVLFGMPADRGVLLTGDAGVQALTNAIEFTNAYGISLRQELKFMQIPRHGHPHNVSPAVLDQLIGPKMTTPAAKERITAFASTAKHSIYPHPAVVNAFIQRGAKVVATNGIHLCHRFNMGSRTGWKPASPMEFSSEPDQWE